MSATRVTFFSKIKNFFAKLFGSVTWEKTASATLTVIAPLVQMLVTLTAGEPVAATVSGVIDNIQQDLASAAAVIGDADAQSSLPNILSSVEANLNTILATIKVSNPTNAAKITSIVDTVIEEIKVIIAEIPTLASSNQPAATESIPEEPATASTVSTVASINNLIPPAPIR